MKRMYSEQDIANAAITGLNIAPKDVNASGNITAPSIIENMDGYSFVKTTRPNLTINYIYSGVVKNGNKITFAINLEVTRTGEVTSDNFFLGIFNIPSGISAKLFDSNTIGLNNVLAVQKIYGAKSYYEGVDAPVVIYKHSNTQVAFTIYSVNSKLASNTLYNFRVEQTFLLDENLAE